MTHYDTNSNKPDGIDAKQATVLTTGGREIDANHHIVNDEAGLVHVYLGERSDGIDISIPVSQVEAVARSDAGREALDIPVAERELVTDGGRAVQSGDIVTVRDEDRSSDPGPWKVQYVYADGEAELWTSAQPLRYEPVGDLTVVEKLEDRTLPHAVPGGDDDDRELVTDGGREPESVKTIWPAGSGDEPWDNECGNPVCNYPIPDSDDFCGVRCGERVRAARALIERSESPDSIIDEYRRVTLDEARTVARALRPGADIEPHPSEYEDEGPTCWSCDDEFVYVADDATYCTNCLYRSTVFDPEALGIGWCGRDGCDEPTQPGKEYCPAKYCNSDEVVNDDDDDEKTLMTDGGEPLPGDDVDTDFSGVDILGADSDDTVRAELPSDLAGDDVDVDVDMSALSESVDVDGIKPPRPVTRTICARALEHDGYTHLVNNEELADRPDGCECDDDGECDVCESADNDRPFDAAHRVKATDAIERTTPAGERDDEEARTVSLYGIAVETYVVQGDFTNEISVRLADETGVIDVRLHPDLSVFEDYDNGDEIFITDVERTGDDDDEAFAVTADSAVMHVKDAEEDLSFALKEQTALVHTWRKFDTLDTKTAARNWVADVLVREWDIETPRGSDEMYMYIDNEDSAQYETFAENGDTHIEEILNQYLPRDENNTRGKNEIVNMVQSRTYVPEDAFSGGAPDHEARKWSVACENGVIDLRTGELHDFDPAFRCRSKLPVEYDPDKSELGEEWDWFLDEVTDEQADRETLMYLIGHALARCYPDEAVFSLIGPGKNGKSVFNNAVSRLFGQVTGSFSFEMVTGDGEFGTKPLVGNHLVIDDDATDVKAQNLGVIKSHSGGSEGQVNIKNEELEGYSNFGTIVMLSNDPPVFGDLSDGAKRRMHPIIMPHRFTTDPTDDHKDTIPKEELMGRLTDDDELEALLAVAVQYSQALYRDSEIESGRGEDERWELYESYSDSILRFWDECMTAESGARVPRSVVYEIYVQWCEREGVDALSPGGGNGFWPLSDQCHAVSYKRGVYTDGERAIEHVMLTETALEYAPGWVSDEWEDDVSEDTSTLANRLDRVTPIGDLSKGYCTTAGRVIGRETIESNGGTAVKLTIEDATRAIDVYDWLNNSDESQLDGINAGDKVRLERVMLTANKGVPQLKVQNVTEIEVTESPLAEEDARHADSGDGGDGGDAAVREVPDDAVAAVEADGGEVSQEARVQSVKDAIVELSGEDGDAPIGDVVELARSDAGIDASSARNQLDALKREGVVYEPVDGEIRLTGGGGD